MENLVKDCKVMQIQNGSAGAETEVDSNIVDLSGFDGVMFVASIGAVSNGTVLTLQPQDNTLNSTSGMANVGSAASYTDVAGESANTLLVADVVNTQKRYARAKLTRTTANAALNCIIAVLYRNKSKPATLDASVIAAAFANATS